MRLVLTMIITLIGSSVYAYQIPAVYLMAAEAHGVDAGLLYSIAKTESSRPGYKNPWFYTANVKGKPFYFEDRESLFAHLEETVKQTDLFDVGPMQISWRHNKHLFNGDLYKATDPQANIFAGSQHLAGLLKSNSVAEATARYHTGSLKTAKRLNRGRNYVSRVLTHLRALQDA